MFLCPFAQTCWAWLNCHISPQADLFSKHWELQSSVTSPFLHGNHHLNGVVNLEGQKWTNLQSGATFSGRHKKSIQIRICVDSFTRKKKLFPFNWTMVKQSCLIYLISLFFLFLSLFLELPCNPMFKFILYFNKIHCRGVNPSSFPQNNYGTNWNSSRNFWSCELPRRDSTFENQWMIM